MDFVLIVCDNAANEICPVWPGQPVTAHWGVLDPAAVNGSAEEIARAFRDAFVTGPKDRTVSELAIGKAGCVGSQKKSNRNRRRVKRC